MARSKEIKVPKNAQNEPLFLCKQAQKTYSVRVLDFVGLFAKMKFCFLTEDFIDSFSVENGDFRLVLFDFLNQNAWT